MKILLDECVTKKLKSRLAEFEVYTVNEMGWAGLKNRYLMRIAMEQGFDMLLTIDKNLEHQQNLNQYAICVVILNAVKSKIEYLEALLPAFKSQIVNFEKGKAYRIER